MDFDNFDVFAEKAAVSEAERIQSLNTDDVYPDPENVRRAIDPAAIDSMAETIKERGQLQAIIVAPRDEDGRYRIKFGERRWRACRQLGIEVKAIVSKTDDDREQVQIDQFIENDQREDLSTADMIAFVVKQAEKRPLAQVAKLTGRDLTQLKRLRSLADAPDYIAALLPDVSMRSALALMQAAKKDDAATRAFIAETDVDDMTVKACEGFSREIGAKGTKPAREEPEPLLVSDDRAPGADDDNGDDRDDDAPISAPSSSPAPMLSPAPAMDETPAPTPDKPNRKAKPRPEAPRPSVEIDGKRALLVEALLHFEGEDKPRLMSWR